MCGKIFHYVFLFGSKILILFGVFSYFFDIGSDIAFNVELIENCHVKYAVFSIIIIVVAIFLSMIFPSRSAGSLLYLYRKKGYKRIKNCGFLLLYLWLNLKDLISNDLRWYEKQYIHCVKFIESIIESIPQIGLSFYIIHHHGWNEDGYIQVLSLAGSILSINLSMATRQAWKSTFYDPPKSKIFKGFLWNFLPITCFLITYYFVMACSSTTLIIFVSIFLVITIISFTYLRKNKKWTKNIFIFAVTLIMACLYSIQALAFSNGLQDEKRLIPFNKYCDYNSSAVEMENSTYIEEMNDLKTLKNLETNLLEKIDNSTFIEQKNNHSTKNLTMIEQIKEQLVTVQKQINYWKDKTLEFLHKHFDYPYVIILWVIVLVFLLFLGIETNFAEKQYPFYYFIIRALEY